MIDDDFLLDVISFTNYFNLLCFFDLRVLFDFFDLRVVFRLVLDLRLRFTPPSNKLTSGAEGRGCACDDSRLEM